MNAKFSPEKITQLLTQGTRQLDGRTLSKLSKARHLALTKQSAHASVLALTPASASTLTARWLIPHTVHQWLAAGLLAAVIVSGAGYWQHAQEQQVSELDVAILTDELPIEVFVD